MKTALLQTNGDPNGALSAFLAGMIEKGIVDEVMAPAAQPGGSASMAVFADVTEMDAIIPWAPVMPVQGARLLSRLSFDDPGMKVAVVLRPCEARAAIELIKLKQILPDNITFVTIDCPGTCELKGFEESGLEMKTESNRMVDQMEAGAATAADGVGLRTACTICVNSSAHWGDVQLHVYGTKGSQSVAIAASDELADALAGAALVTFDAEPLSGRDAVVEGVNKGREAAREKVFAEMTEDAQSLEGLKKRFSTCIRCLNCMENCPICYCKQCIFKSTTFDHPGSSYAKWAMRKGVQKMPSETMLFHLTRLNHMATSCIGCGLCDTACPMGLPVASLFSKVANGVQGMLDYKAGASLEDPIPLSVFREDELQEESGAEDF